jgi:hypothetical protein
MNWNDIKSEHDAEVFCHSEEIVKKLRRAFAGMRKAGILAKQSMSGCRCCYGLGTQEVDEARAKGKEIQGGAYYMRQDRVGFDTGESVLYVNFFGLDDGLSHLEVGKIVAKCLREEGVGITWDGTENACVKIHLIDPDTVKAEFGVGTPVIEVSGLGRRWETRYKAEVIGHGFTGSCEGPVDGGRVWIRRTHDDEGNPVNTEYAHTHRVYPGLLEVA